MANEKTTNLGLELTTDENTLFKNWHRIINGKGPILDKAGNKLADKSNAELIDDAIGKITTDFLNYYKKTETYSQAETNEAIANAVKDLTKFDIKVVSSIDDVTETGHIYLVPKSPAQPNNGYYEYIYVAQSKKAELIGSTDITVDTTLSTTSNNPIANSAVKTKFDTVDANILDIDDDIENLNSMFLFDRIFDATTYGTTYGYDEDFDEYWFDMKVFIDDDANTYGLSYNLMLGGSLAVAIIPRTLEDDTQYFTAVTLKSNGIGMFTDPGTTGFEHEYATLELTVYTLDNKILTYRGVYDPGLATVNITAEDLVEKIKTNQLNLFNLSDNEEESENFVFRVSYVDERPAIKTINNENLYGDGNIDLLTQADLDDEKIARTINEQILEDKMENEYVSLDGEQTLTARKTWVVDSLKQAIQVNCINTKDKRNATVNYDGFAVKDGGSTYLKLEYNRNSYTNGFGFKLNTDDDTGIHYISMPATDGTIALLSDLPGTSNFVTIADEQTITGAKNFANNTYTKFTPANGSTSGAYVSVGYDGITARNGSSFLKQEYNATNYVHKFGFKMNSGDGTKYISLPNKTGTLATLDDITGGGGTASAVSYITTAPIADNPDAGTLKFVVLSEEPTTKYNGYIYIITE